MCVWTNLFCLLLVATFVTGFAEEDKVEARCAQSSIIAKQQALDELTHLDGWCSPFKASVLWDLTIMIQPRCVVEIGVFGGKSLIPIAMALRENGRGVVFGIDPWDSLESIIEMPEVNQPWWRALDHNRVLQRLNDIIVRLQLQAAITLIRSTSEAAEPIANIDMLHIDGNHGTESALLDVNKWVPLVRPGGIIVFDDTTWPSTDCAVQWLDEHCIRLFETVDKENCWGVWIKK